MSRPSPWIALEAGVDARASAQRLRRAHERFFSGADGAAVRPVISASWRRCVRAGVSPDAGEVPLLDRAALGQRRAASGLAAAVPGLREVLGGTGHLLIVTDADGHLL